MSTRLSLHGPGRNRRALALGPRGALGAFDGMTLPQIVESVRLLRMLGDRTLLDVFNQVSPEGDPSPLSCATRSNLPLRSSI